MAFFCGEIYSLIYGFINWFGHAPFWVTVPANRTIERTHTHTHAVKPIRDAAAIEMIIIILLSRFRVFSFLFVELLVTTWLEACAHQARKIAIALPSNETWHGTRYNPWPHQMKSSVFFSISRWMCACVRMTVCGWECMPLHTIDFFLQRSDLNSVPITQFPLFSSLPPPICLFVHGPSSA